MNHTYWQPGAVRALRTVLMWLALPAGAACQLGARHPSPEAQARWTQDSAAYVRDSTKWVRDSVVRDSISRTINTDSLYHLYHRMLLAKDPATLMGLVNCEDGRLSWKYGAEPAELATRRMQDTLWRPGERDAAKRMWDRIQNMSVGLMATQGVSPRKCGWEPPAMGEFYNGTDLLAVGGRPRPGPRFLAPDAFLFSFTERL